MSTQGNTFFFFNPILASTALSLVLTWLYSRQTQLRRSAWGFDHYRGDKAERAKNKADMDASSHSSCIPAQKVKKKRSRQSSENVLGHLGRVNILVQINTDNGNYPSETSIWDLNKCTRYDGEWLEDDNKILDKTLESKSRNFQKLRKNLSKCDSPSDWTLKWGNHQECSEVTPSPWRRSMRKNVTVLLQQKSQGAQPQKIEPALCMCLKLGQITKHLWTPVYRVKFQKWNSYHTDSKRKIYLEGQFLSSV